MANRYRNVDPSIMYQPAGAMFEGQEFTPANGTGGQFIQIITPLPDNQMIFQKQPRVADVMVGLRRHENAKRDNQLSFLSR